MLRHPISLGMLAVLMGAALPADPAPAQTAAAEYHYVANTRPPDAFLALRTDPSSSVGRRITTMENGTLIQVLERRADGWWRVRVAATGQVGWALRGQHGRNWIDCCQTVTGSLPSSGKPLNSSTSEPE